jgi:hypothetical protein
MSVRRTNWFWSVSLEHKLFLDFLKLFVNMRLAVSFAGKQKAHYLDLWIKSYGCLKFEGEVWVGRACAAANEEELTACAKFCGQGGWARGAGDGQSGAPALGRLPTTGRGGRPRSAQRSVTAGRAAVARRPGNQRSPGRRPLPSCSEKRYSKTNPGKLFKWGFFRREGHLVYRFAI